LWRVRKIPYIAYIHDPISYIIRKVYSKGALSHFFPVMLSAGHYLDRVIVSEARKCLTQSMFHLKFLKNIVKGNIEVLYPGCYPENAIRSNRGEYLLTMKSMWDANKNAGFLLKLLSEVKHDARLIMVGGWERNFYESFIKKVKGRGLEDRVEIKGYVNEDELMRLYRNARLLIHPSVEAFGMSGLEAASYGCPFIMPEGSGVTDIFSHGVHGFFPREGDLYNYIKFTDKLLSDERFAWRMGKTAWVKAKQYTWKRHSMQLARIIDSILQ
jgi:glycosyltransferase involved in cell wall biosynthesis